MQSGISSAWPLCICCRGWSLDPPSFRPIPHPWHLVCWRWSVSRYRWSSQATTSFVGSIWSWFFPIRRSFACIPKVPFGRVWSPHPVLFLLILAIRAHVVRISFEPSIFCPLQQYYRLLRQWSPFVFTDSVLIPSRLQLLQAALWGFKVLPAVWCEWTEWETVETQIYLLSFSSPFEGVTHSCRLSSLSTTQEREPDALNVGNSTIDCGYSRSGLRFCYYCNRSSSINYIPA